MVHSIYLISRVLNRVAVSSYIRYVFETVCSLCVPPRLRLGFSKNLWRSCIVTRCIGHNIALKRHPHDIYCRDNGPSLLHYGLACLRYETTLALIVYLRESSMHY